MFRRFVSSALVLIVALCMTPAESTASPPSDPGQVRRGTDRFVTLITGDRVRLINGTTQRIVFEPRAGRGHIKVRNLRVPGKFYVIPLDVEPLVASGRLDRRLFDVTGLIEAGMDDQRSRSLPLIVTYAGRAGAASVRAGGAEVVRDLPSVNGSAVRVTKGQGFGVLSGERLAADVERVWLDGKRQVTLDRSVAQIGGPAAWQAGLTGKGVTVAVLDTGVDATHPDLDDRVSEARNFTEEPAEDQVGHGTHVASTIAGTGSRYRGVAPDAKILDGKVCGTFGCSESAIIAGMQWAASEKHADVINLSLGGPDSPGIDPVEEAVNTLTAETGSLFVVAAGNSGPFAETVGSPGSADAALAVGAVDKADAIAKFSSRGPRVGDGAVKPDITAPGVDIVAARSKDGTIGTPVRPLPGSGGSGGYVRLSGTSMATPHAAGAAALLAQQHPERDASWLKAALMASAKVHPSQGVFEQGAGRVDVARAIKQTVVTEPGSVSLGTALWPHHDDTAVTKQVAYRNDGSSPVTLNLQASMTDPTGAAAPAGALTLSASSVTVPAGGTASVTVTSNTRHDGPDGAYSGRIVATGPGDVSVSTVLGVDKEVESYNLTVNHIDTNGQLTGTADTVIIGLDGKALKTATGQDGTATVRLPKGRYFLDGLMFGEGENGLTVHHLVQPDFTLDADDTVSIDARLARPVTVTLPRAEATVGILETGLTFTTGDLTIGSGFFVFGGSDGLFTTQLGGPVTAPDSLTARLAAQGGVLDANGSFTNSPYTYGVVNSQQGSYWHGFHRAVRDHELAKVVTGYNAQVQERQANRLMFGLTAGQSTALALDFRYDLPARATHYLEGGAVKWSGQLGEGFDESVTALVASPQSFVAGSSYLQRFNAAVFGPRIAPDSRAIRTGNSMFVNVAMYSDQDGHVGFSRTDTASTKLFRNGVLIGESGVDALLEVDNVAPEPADFTLVSSATRPNVSGLSTRTDAVWRFRSKAASENGEPLPLWAVRYFPAVDDRNSVERSAVTVLPVGLERQSGSASSLDVRVSGDDGVTWTKAAVRRTGDNRYVAVVATPKGGYVSLQAKVADSNGNTTEQTIIRAYQLR